jgi:glucosamine 6-phosphate synthetase-like amidotransferase/phosphosugar isomerase protein
LCIVEAAKALGTISEDLYKKYIDGFERLSESCDDAREKTIKWFYDHQSTLMLGDKYHIVAYGANFGTIMEARLKFMESHLRPTMVFELEEFMHGPIRSVRRDEMVLFLATEKGPERDRMIQLYQVMKEYTENCVLIQGSDNAVEDPLALTFDAVNMEFLNTIEFLVPIQVLSFLISYHLGLDMTEKKTLSIKEKMGPSFSD